MATVDQIGVHIAPSPQRQAKPQKDVSLNILSAKPVLGDQANVTYKVSKPTVEAPQQKPTPQEVTEMLNQVASGVDLFEIQAKFSINQATGEIQIQVVNNTTGEVIRRIPPYEAVKLLLETGAATGLLMDQKG